MDSDFLYHECKLISKYYISLGKLDSAKINVAIMLKYAKESNSDYQLIESYKLFSEVCTILQNYKQAIIFRDSSELIEKRLNELTGKNEIERLKYTYLQKEKNEEIQKQKNYFWIVFLFLALSLIAIFVVLYFYKKTIYQKNVIEQSEQFKTVLLKELNHRVKNNLQMLSALVRYQKRHSNQAEVTEALQESEIRLEALSLIHNELYASETEIYEVELRKYMNDLIVFMKQSFPSNLFDIEVKVDPVLIHIEDAVSIGIVVNELLMNSVKHNPETSLKIGVVFRKEKEDVLYFMYQDNGIPQKSDHTKQEDELQTKPFGTKMIEFVLKHMRGKPVHKLTEDGFSLSSYIHLRKLR